MPTPTEGETRDEFVERCIPIVIEDGTAQDSDQAVAVCNSMWEDANKAQEPKAGEGKNTLKAISKTDDELRAGNYLVLFGGRDLEGIGSDAKNQDGTIGEFFTQKTAFTSPYTDTGVLYVDWEHGRGKAMDGADAPGRDDVLGYVDWKTARVDDRGLWVERVLNRRNKYMRWLETLIGEGLVGNSSEAIPEEAEKKADGEIVRWPLRRDTLTVTPMEPRMLTENAVSALKALGVYPEPDEPEAQPEAPVDTGAVEAARLRADIAKFQITLRYGGNNNGRV